MSSIEHSNQQAHTNITQMEPTSPAHPASENEMKVPGESANKANISNQVQTESGFSGVPELYQDAQSPNMSDQFEHLERGITPEPPCTPKLATLDDLQPDLPDSPEPEFWGDMQSEELDYSDQGSEPTTGTESALGSPAPTSTLTSCGSPPPRSQMRLTEGRTTDNRLLYYVSLINRAKRHCFQLIEDKQELHRKLEAAFLEKRIMDVGVARLKLERNNLDRENDDLKREIKKLKAKQEHCRKNHW